MTSFASRLTARVLSRGGNGRRLVVLAYHRVFAKFDALYPEVPDVDLFASQMKVLRDRFNVIRLSDGVEGLKNGALPPGAVAITFDDGYADNYHVAFPVLRDLGLPATFFVATGYLDGGCMFNDKVIEACRLAPAGSWATGLPDVGTVHVDEQNRFAAVKQVVMKLKYLSQEQRNEYADRLLDGLGGVSPPEIMMESGHVKRLHRSGMDIGAHTMTHPILAQLDDEQAEREIDAGRRTLETLIDAKVSLFAYPNGRPETDYTSRDVRLVERAGFAGAVSTVWGCADAATDRYQLPRISPWDRTDARFTLRLLRAFRQLPVIQASER